MMCERPYCKTPLGITPYARLNAENRAAATPFPCGRCLPCRINKSRVWINRIMLEAGVSSDAVFFTLTYDDEHIGLDWSLYKRDLQLFFKRLRRRLEPQRVRYFAVGEYSKDHRPHYHGVIFGLSRLDDNLVSDAWGKGFIYLGDVTKQSAAYIAGYVIKDWTHKDNPNLLGKEPEFMVCSKGNGGIGYGAVKQIADQLKKNQFFKPRIIREVKYGKNKKMPLGRHLTEKMNQELGITDDVKEEALWEYQEEIFEMHLDKDVFYWQSIVNEKAAERKAQAKRKKIFRKKESI